MGYVTSLLCIRVEPVMTWNEGLLAQPQYVSRLCQLATAPGTTELLLKNVIRNLPLNRTAYISAMS
jgi:hypothetical protein